MLRILSLVVDRYIMICDGYCVYYMCTIFLTPGNINVREINDPILDISLRRLQCVLHFWEILISCTLKYTILATPEELPEFWISHF